MRRKPGKLYFSDAQGQLISMSVMRSDQNSNSSMLLCMSWLPTRMKKDQMKNECARTSKI